MGAKASTIWYVDAPDPIAVLRESTTPNWESSSAIIGRLFPEQIAVPTHDAPISVGAAADSPQVFVGTYPGTTVVCSTVSSVVKPSTMPETWTRPVASEHTFLIATDPATAWGAFAYWERGKLRRSFSATPIYIYEDIGLPLVWERPFWAGKHPLVYPPGVMPDPQSLPFHPQEFAEAANAEWFGFRYTGAPRSGELNPASLPVCGFTVYPPGVHPPEPAPAPAPIEQPRQDRSLMKWLRRKSPEPRS